MKRFDSHPEEALMLEKLGLLVGAEREALRVHLAECGACRAELWAHGHHAFRVEQRTVSDTLLDTIAVAAALKGLNQRAPLKAPWRHALPLVLGVALPIAALAAAGVWSLQRPKPVLAPTTVAQSIASASVSIPLSVPVPVPVPVPVSVPEPVPPLSSSRSAAPASSTAADLFGHAGELKRAGQGARAVVVYRELQRRFASSPEAKLSYVIAGGLLLDQGEAARAIAEFDRYLATSGPASEEALVGRAHALQRLGRSPEEALAWQQLLTRFPASVHARGARTRLAQLGAAAAAPDRP